ncbi:hypothetical protein HDU83_002542 [Entophlyctis luteolus]|nr:hypothetical protein HDU83_002542 [Entophlyctis luteolus]
MLGMPQAAADLQPQQQQPLPIPTSLEVFEALALVDEMAASGEYKRAIDILSLLMDRIVTHLEPLGLTHSRPVSLTNPNAQVLTTSTAASSKKPFPMLSMSVPAAAQPLPPAPSVRKGKASKTKAHTDTASTSMINNINCRIGDSALFWHRINTQWISLLLSLASEAENTTESEWTWIQDCVRAWSEVLSFYGLLNYELGFWERDICNVLSLGKQKCAQSHQA